MNTVIEPGASSESPRSTAQYLTFTVGHELLGVEVLYVREITACENLTVVPKMPPHIRGMINLRGTVLPVIDLSARFGAAPTQIGKRTCLIIMDQQGSRETQALGAMVDAVNGVRHIATEDIQPPPSFGGPVSTEFIAGVTQVKGGFVVLLSPQRVFDMQELKSAAARSEPLVRRC